MTKTEEDCETKLTEMEKSIANIPMLRSSYKSAKQQGEQFRLGYEYQIETTYKIRSEVKEVEHSYNGSNRADILFKDGSFGECKYTTDWGKAWKQFASELMAYAASGHNLRFFMRYDPPKEIKAMMQYYLGEAKMTPKWSLLADDSKKSEEALLPLYYIASPLDSDPHAWFVAMVKWSEEMEKQYRDSLPEVRGWKVYS